MLKLQLRKRFNEVKPPAFGRKQKVGKRDTLAQQDVKKVLADINQNLIVMIKNN